MVTFRKSKRHLNRADAASLTGVSAELFDPAKNAIDLQRILTQDAALQHERVSRAGAVAHFAKPVDALVGVHTNDGTAEGRPMHPGHAQIRNLQL